MTAELHLPDFELDCREWLVATEAGGDFPDDVDGMPVIAMLSTAVAERSTLHVATAVLGLGLLDDVRLTPAATAPSSGTEGGEDQRHRGADVCVADVHWDNGHAHYVLPVPGGELVVVAEFRSEPDPPLILVQRFHALLRSLCWHD